MADLSITISWEWALGIIGVLILIAWKGSARFTALETSMDWVKKILDELKLNTDNNSSGNPAFASHSPVSLTEAGKNWLLHSGLKEFIDSKKNDFLKDCKERNRKNPYEVQSDIFQLFQELPFDEQLDDKLKKFAFEKGTTMGVMRRVGAIYLRDLCLSDFGMKVEDIDKHELAN